LAAALLATAVGCSGASGASDADDANGGEAALERRSVTIALAHQGGDLELADTPKLKSGASGDLSCGPAFDGREGKRYECKRGSERLELLHRPDANTATLLYTDGSAKRVYFACTGDSTLDCETKQPSTGGNGGLSSPLKSTVDGISIPNAHTIDGSALLLRGMAPRTDAQFDELQSHGVKAVLLFKNPTGHDVEDEMAKLDSLGFPAERVHHVPFRWKDMPSFKEACEQTVDALGFLAEQQRAGKKTYFHCTVGEDRTGYLAALSRLLKSPSTDPRELFNREMCERGYGEGNPLKPTFVTSELAHGLTPLYRKLAFLVKTGALKTSSLDPSVCADDPESAAAFRNDDAFGASDYKCGTSTAFEP
jgi:hypothetical protein